MESFKSWISRESIFVGLNEVSRIPTIVFLFCDSKHGQHQHDDSRSSRISTKISLCYSYQFKAWVLDTRLSLSAMKVYDKTRVTNRESPLTLLIGLDTAKTFHDLTSIFDTVKTGGVNDLEVKNDCGSYIGLLNILLNDKERICKLIFQFLKTLCRHWCGNIEIEFWYGKNYRSTISENEVFATNRINLKSCIPSPCEKEILDEIKPIRS